MSGGKFYVDNDHRPCFLPNVDEGETAVVETLATNIVSGIKIVTENAPSELRPGEYLQMGVVRRAVKFTQIVSYTDEYLETYMGEFKLGEGGSVEFPSSIRWYGELSSPVEYNDDDTIYQYTIVNGLGQIKAFYDNNIVAK